MATDKTTPLKQARLDREESVTHVADHVGTHPSNLSRIETGTRQPTQKLARALYRYYGGTVSLGHIYDPTFGLE